MIELVRAVRQFSGRTGAVFVLRKGHDGGHWANRPRRRRLVDALGSAAKNAGEPPAGRAAAANFSDY